jgi:hypothetical protein
VAEGYSADPFSANLLQELASSSLSRPQFSLVSGIIRYKG